MAQTRNRKGRRGREQDVAGAYERKNWGHFKGLAALQAPWVGIAMIYDRTAAVGLLTRDDLHGVGQSIARAWPVDRSSTFDALLEAIEKADREFWLALENPR